MVVVRAWGRIATPADAWVTSHRRHLRPRVAASRPHPSLGMPARRFRERINSSAWAALINTYLTRSYHRDLA